MAKFCRFCGSPINGGVKFCPECGKKLAEDLPPQPKNQPVTPAPQRPVYQTPQQQTPAQPPKTLQTAYAVNTPPVRTAPSQAPQTTVAPNQTNSPAPGRVFCPKCGSVVDAGVRFCSKCGAQIPQTTSQTSPQTTPVKPVRQTVQTVAGQAARPITQTASSAVRQFAQTTQQSPTGFGGAASGLRAFASPGETALELAELNTAASAVKSGGMPGILKFLISIAAGGLSIPLLSGLGSPASFFVGAGISLFLIIVSAIIKKKVGGGGK